jgi:transcription antitermination factor NusG
MREELTEMPALLPEAGHGTATGTCREKVAADPLRLPVNGEEWIVVRTRPRCEKKLKEVCNLKQVNVYLPLSEKTHSYGRRERTFSSPLFSGYLFSLANPDQCQWIQQSRFTARILRTGDQGVLIRELQTIRTALLTDEVLEVFPFLTKGRPIRVLSGPLRGAEGVVARLKGKTRVLVNVELIQQSVAIEVECHQLAPL